MNLQNPMDDLDMLYDYYKDNNLAVGGYAILSSRVKDDRVEAMLRRLSAFSLKEAMEVSKLIIHLGGKIY